MNEPDRSGVDPAAITSAMPPEPVVPGWGVPLSLGLHAALCAAALLAAPQQMEPAPARSISADIISAAEYESLFGQVPATEEPVVEEATPPAEAPEDGFVAAETFHAADILRDPDNQEVRQNLPRLAATEQVVQLCNIEALEQLRLNGVAGNADVLVGYAYAPIDIDGLSLSADGGAFRSQGQWYRIRYRCAVTADITAVTRFEYAVGDQVPESEWEEHFLNADDDWLSPD